MSCYQKDPQARLNYSIDWSDWLNGDSITASEWILPEGLTAYGDSESHGSTTVLIGGGVDCHDYVITNKITTAAGLINLRSFTLQVRVLIPAQADFTSQSKRILDAIDAMIAGKATLDQKAYKIGDRELERYSFDELWNLRKGYAQLVANEQRAADQRNNPNGGFFKTIYTRFGQTS